MTGFALAGLTASSTLGVILDIELSSFGLTLGGIGDRFLGRLKPDLGMGAVAEWFRRGRAAAAKRHPILCRIRVPINVLELHAPGHDVRSVLDDLDCYVSHDSPNLVQTAAVTSPIHKKRSLSSSVPPRS